MGAVLDCCGRALTRQPTKPRGCAPLRIMSTQAAISSRKPFLPSYLPRDPPGRAFARACFAAGNNTACGYQNSAEQVAQLLWPRDLVTHAVAKAATNSDKHGGHRRALGHRDRRFSRIACRRIRWRSLNYRRDAHPARWRCRGQHSASLNRTAGAREGGEGGEGEMAQSSGGEEVFAQLLREDLAGSLDASLFSNTAGSAIRPPGLLSGVSPLTATTGGGASALQGDIAKVGGAVAAATGSANIAFIASPAYALRMMTYKTVLEPSEDGVQIWPSIAVPDAH